MKILVVDDNASLANSIRRCLEYEDYFVNIAKDGIAALELLDGNHFDLLLTDVHMPGMGGVELAKSAAGRFPKLNIVLMSAYEFPEAASVFDRLTKPFDIDELLNLVNRLRDSM